MMNRPVQAGAARAKAPGCPFPLQGIDLHLHSTFSDGLKTPEELCAMAVKAGVGHVALCDHDTVRGVAAMQKAAQAQGIVCYAGAEVSTGQGGKTHVLCYGDNVVSSAVQSYLANVEGERTQRAQKVLQLLKEQGIVIPDDLQHELLAQPNVGRAHIARALVRVGAVNTVQQAFDRYLEEGRPAYAARTLLPTAQAVRDLSSMNVLTVLAHPMGMRLEMPALHALIRSLKQCGLRGVECFHPSANARTARELERIARQEQLLVTGGSDYHGDAGSTVRVGRLPSGWNSREADLAAFAGALTNF